LRGRAFDVWLLVLGGRAFDGRARPGSKPHSPSDPSACALPGEAATDRLHPPARARDRPPKPLILGVMGLGGSGFRRTGPAGRGRGRAPPPAPALLAKTPRLFVANPRHRAPYVCGSRLDSRRFGAPFGRGESARPLHSPSDPSACALPGEAATDRLHPPARARDRPPKPLTFELLGSRSDHAAQPIQHTSKSPGCRRAAAQALRTSTASVMIASTPINSSSAARWGSLTV